MTINCAVIQENSTLKQAIIAINDSSANGAEPGIGIVVDSLGRSLGVVTDGDIRKSICNNIDFSVPVRTVMSTKFVHVFEDQALSEQLEYALGQGSRFRSQGDPRITKVVVCDREMRLKGIVNLLELLKQNDLTAKTVAVYGMGYVGLTLALTFAEIKKLKVIGVDIKPEIVDSLKSGVPTFYENGLQSLLSYCLNEKLVSFSVPEQVTEADIHVISVGTPIDENKKVIYDYLQKAGATIGRALKRGNLVVCRSTVPVGTTRKYLVPILAKESGLRPGIDFNIAFAPERTVEGNALKELKSLPQVVGGFSQACRVAATKLFQTINPTIVQVENLEAAEVVKLINNTFRDTVFSFANDVALLCDDHNINAFDLIAAANEGYPRNPIPLPSPGVGGICLVKDPHLYEYSKSMRFQEQSPFGGASRHINQRMPTYVLSKFEAFRTRYGLNGKNKTVMIAGLAFKGLPETSDMRFSPGVELAELLRERGYEVLGWDAVATPKDITACGIKPSSIAEGFQTASAVFFMNNHPLNTKFDLYKALSESSKPLFLFDGWNQFSRHEVETLEGVVYGTLGYMTQQERVKR